MTRDELIAEMERQPDPQILIETIAQWCDERGMDHREITAAIADAIAAYLDATDAP